MRWIYISPHLDDSVLSAGGLIYDQAQAGLPVEIWTIFSGSPHPGELTPLAQLLHTQWGTINAEETIKIRRAEDLHAASILGAHVAHFDVPDCIYRRGPGGEPLYLDVFTTPHRAEAGLPGQIAQAIAERLLPDDQVVCQLALGGHVDHVLVRQAVEQLGLRLLYLADVPYLFNEPDELEKKTIRMKLYRHSVSDAGLKSWFEAILFYASQISTLFASPEQMKEAIRSYWKEWNGLPLWGIG